MPGVPSGTACALPASQPARPHRPHPSPKIRMVLVCRPALRMRRLPRVHGSRRGSPVPSDSPAHVPVRKRASVNWVIRWTDEQTDQDMSAVIEAPTRDAAVMIATAQGLPTLFVARATQSDIAESRRARPRRAATSDGPTAAAAHAYTCLGRPLGRAQVAALLLAGVATALLHLRPVLPAIMS